MSVVAERSTASTAATASAAVARPPGASAPGRLPTADDVVPQLTARAVRAAAAVALTRRATPAELAALLLRAGATPVPARWEPFWHPANVEPAMRAAAWLQPDRHRFHGTPHWQAMESVDLAWTGRDALQHSVFVSPQPWAVRPALRAVLAVVVELDVPAVRVDACTHGVLRPDAVVLAHRDPAHAAAVADRLVAELAGVPCRGVPFTGQVGPRPGVSRGIDPWHTTWRAAVTGAVATAVHHAAASEHVTRREAGRRLPQMVESVAAQALSTVASFGLDVVTWWPPARLPRRLDGRRGAA